MQRDLDPMTTPRAARPRCVERLSRTALLAALALAPALGGCGFHLQGASPLPRGIDKLSVSYHDNYTVGDPEVVTALRERLRRQHLLGSDDAPAALDIVSVQRSQRTIAVSPIDGDSAVYELSVRVVFNYSVRGSRQLTGATVAATRDYTADATQRLSSDDERYHTLDQMQDDLANRILERIARHNDQLATSAATDAATD